MTDTKPVRPGSTEYPFSRTFDETGIEGNSDQSSVGKTDTFPCDRATNRSTKRWAVDGDGGQATMIPRTLKRTDTENVTMQLGHVGGRC